MRRKLLRYNIIPMSRKKIVVKSCFLSKGLFHAGTWADLNRSEAKKVHCNAMAIYRGVRGAGNPVAAKVSDQNLINEMEILSPLSLVAYEGIVLFVRLIRKLQGPLLLGLCVAYDGKKSRLKVVEDTLDKLAGVSHRY